MDFIALAYHNLSLINLINCFHSPDSHRDKLRGKNTLLPLKINKKKFKNY